MTLALQYSDPICPFKDPPPETIDPLENEVKWIVSRIFNIQSVKFSQVIEIARKFLNKEGTVTCIGDNEYDIAETYPTINANMLHIK